MHKMIFFKKKSELHECTQEGAACLLRGWLSFAFLAT